MAGKNNPAIYFRKKQILYHKRIYCIAKDIANSWHAGIIILILER